MIGALKNADELNAELKGGRGKRTSGRNKRIKLARTEANSVANLSADEE